MSSLLNNPHGTNLPPTLILPKDKKIAELERFLVAKPGNIKAAEKLLGTLEFYQPSVQGIGTFSDCQRKFVERYYKPEIISGVLESGNYAEEYKKWVSILVESNVNAPFFIIQLAIGKLHSIGNILSDCRQRMKLFNEEGVISRFCHDCHKVQILPVDLVGLMQTYFILRIMKLPRDNSRKCMIEVRERVKFPYKGYIYCDSEEEAFFCRDVFQKLMKKYNISNLRCGLSHGCSEHGLEHPDFKYDKDGSYREFPRPKEWDEKEARFFANTPKSEVIRKDKNKPGISVRDVIGFDNWVDYAEIIGDDTWKLFRNKPGVKRKGRVVERMREQATKRNEELHELREMMASSA